jgi:hypothetical protein
VPTLTLLLSFALLALSATTAAAQQTPYRTPRAGEGFETELLGRPVLVPRRDRRSTRALTLGAAYFDPALGDANVTPLFNLYWLRYWRDRRIYGLFSGVYNRIEFAEHLAPLGRFRRDGILEAIVIEENYTIPTPLVEATDVGRNAPGSEVWWGRISLEGGLGLRKTIAPRAVDNDMRAQLLAHAEWDYYESVDSGDDQTVPGAIIPHDGLIYGGRFVLRFDGIERNLLELPHKGVAAGAAVDLLRRDRWREAGLLGATATPRDTRDIIRLTSYLYAAFGAPGFSERHRFVAQVHAGWSPPGSVDRFSAFRLGTGPLQSEANDLVRASYPGASFDQLTADRYAIASLTYRYEVLFFLFLHARVVGAWGRVGEWDPTAWRQRFVKRSGLAYCAGVTSGFAFKSQLSFEYSYDTGFARDGRDGHGFLLMWSKSF